MAPLQNKGQGNVTKRKYASLLVSGMKLGFSFNEVVSMRLPMLNKLISAHNEQYQQGGTREATQADIDRMLA